MRAVCYCRTSTLDQAREEKVSLPDQINWAKTFALEKGWQWGNEYIEPGVTGDVEPEERDALSKLLEDARNDKFDILLIYHSSRLAREPDIGMRVCRLLGQLRIQTYFRNAPVEPVDKSKFAWGTNIGSQYMNAFSFIGDFQENVARSERVRSGFIGLAKRGKLVFAPFGYKKISEIKIGGDGRQKYDWRFELDPSKSLIVQRIFRDYLTKGGSLRQLMISLNKEKIASPSGNISNEAWSAATIRNILTNATYVGKIRWGRKLGGKYLQGKTNTGKQRRVFSDPQDWITRDGEHPKIIDEMTFSRVQEKIKIRGLIPGRAMASGGLLTGLIVCGRCGRKGHFKNRRLKKNIAQFYCCGSYTAYKSCKRYIMSAPKIHNLVIEEINKLVTNKKYREKLLSRDYVKKNGATKKRLSTLIQNLEAVQTKQRRVLVAYESETLTLEEFGDAKRRLDDESIQLSNEIGKLEKLINDKDESKKAKRRFLDILKNFKSNFVKSEFSKQKDIVQSLLEKVIVKGNRVEIFYRV